MPDLGTSTAAPTSRGEAESNGHRVERRRSLPGGRAVVGALLITLAVIGVFAAWLSATATPTTSWVVMAATLAAGDEVAEDDVATVAIDLPDEQATRAFTNPRDVVGSVALAPMDTGDLVTRSAVRAPGDVADRALFSFDVPVARALGGQLDPGDRVDVMATDDGRTGFVATDLEVVRGTIEGGTVTITLALDDPQQVLALGNAVDEATVHLVLATAGAGTDAGVTDDPFAPPAGPDEAPDQATGADPAAPATVDPSEQAIAPPGPGETTEPAPAATGGG